jgi:hypothetical protein
MPTGDLSAVALLAVIGFGLLADEWNKGERKVALVCAVLLVLALGAFAGLYSRTIAFLALGGFFVLDAVVNVLTWKQGRVTEAQRGLALLALLVGVIAGLISWVAFYKLTTGEGKADMTAEDWNRLPLIVYTAGAVAVTSAMFLASLGAALLALGPNPSRKG